MAEAATHTLVLVAADATQAEAIAATIRALDHDARHDARHFVRTTAPAGHELPVAPAPDIHAVWFLTDLSAPDIAPLRARLAPEIEGHITNTVEHWGAPPDLWADAPRRIAFVRRLESIDHATFRARWAVHATLARAHHPSIGAYTQHLIVESFGPAPATFDGIAEFAYLTHSDGTPLPRYSSEEGRAILQADVAQLLAPGGSRSVWVQGA